MSDQNNKKLSMASRSDIVRQAYFKRIGYVPHQGQVLYHNSQARFRLANCGRRFGKSFMAARDLEPKLLEPNKRFWIVGPTYDLAEKEFRVIWRDMIVNLGFGKDPSVSTVYNKRQGNMYIEFTDRNTILEVRSAQNPENLVGESLDGVIMSEAAKHTQETWDRYIRPALGDRRGFADFTTTPEGFNWLYDEWMRGQDDRPAGFHLRGLQRAEQARQPRGIVHRFLAVQACGEVAARFERQRLQYAAGVDAAAVMRDDFAELYLHARRLGLRVMLFTNAALVTEGTAALLARVPPLEAVEAHVLAPGVHRGRLLAALRAVPRVGGGDHGSLVVPSDDRRGRPRP